MRWLKLFDRVRRRLVLAGKSMRMHHLAVAISRFAGW